MRLWPGIFTLSSGKGIMPFRTLKTKHQPLTIRKSVVLKKESKKTETYGNQRLLREQPQCGLKKIILYFYLLFLIK